MPATGRLAQAIGAQRAAPTLSPQLEAADSACALTDGSICALGFDRAKCAGCPYRSPLPLPSISVCISSRNEGEKLTKTVNSIIKAEPLKTPEIIVEDDGSDVPEPIHERTIHHRSDLNHGMSQGRRAALDRAHGEQRFWVDAHMDFAPWAFSRVARIAQVYNCVAFACPTGYFGADLLFEGGLLWAKWAKREKVERIRLYRSTAVMGAEVCIGAKILDQWGGYPIFPGIWGLEEELLGLLCLFHGIQTIAVNDVQNPYHEWRKAKGDPNPGLPERPYPMRYDQMAVNVASFYRWCFDDASWELWKPRLRNCRIYQLGSGVPEHCIQHVEQEAWSEYAKALRSQFKKSESEMWMDWLTILSQRELA